MGTDFKSIAIVNRGEPAMRLIHAVREFNNERNTRIRTIALFTEPDRSAMFVREADDAFELGAPFYVDAKDGRRKSRYLDYQSLERVLRASRAEAVWVGWGFVAEHAEFADLCQRLGLVFVGPSGKVMRQLGDKITSKLLAEQAKVPVAPWSGGPVASLEEARRHAETLGYPLIVKATAGGGGRGIRKVLHESELADAFESARSEALTGFGDATVFLERLFGGARHVEVQIIGDNFGKIWALGVRDCTIQRRHQKVLEESPSPALTAEQDRVLREAAARLGSVVGYRNAGTVEFLYDPAGRTFSFMEVNARLQVEHPVTELTTGLDLVKLQLQVARGEPLVGEAPASQGHAVEVRLNAEDPFNVFAPAPGEISLFRLPHGPGLRIDTGVEEGDQVASEFDSMIAKIIAVGTNRQEALSRLRRALSEATVVIQGGTSNKGFLLELLNRPEVAAGNYDVGWLDRLVQAGEHVSRQNAEVALLQAAVEAYEAEMEVERAQFMNLATRGRPQVREEVGRQVELSHRGNSYSCQVYRLSAKGYRVDVAGRRVDLEVERQGPSQRLLVCLGRRYRVLSVVQGVHHLIEVNGIPHRISRDQGGMVRAPSPSMVVSILVKEGDSVDVGDRLAVLEAMKIEMSILSELSGKVRKVLVSSNVQVGSGDPIMLIEPSKDWVGVSAAERLHFEEFGQPKLSEEDAQLHCARNLDDLKGLMLGFDVDPAELSRLLVQQGEFCKGVPPDDPRMLQSEDEILRIFIDNSSLFERQPQEVEETARQGSESYLFTYLRDLNSEGKNLPPTFVEKLKRVLRLYGIQSLERTPQLEESLIRVFKAHLRIQQQLGPVLSVLDRRLENAEALAGKIGDDFRSQIDRMIEATQGVFPTINDLAREIRYRYFEQPLLDSIRREVWDRAEAQLTELAQGPGPEERRRLVQELVDCPQPLKSLLASRLNDDHAEVRQTVLEIMTRRYYRIRNIEEITPVEIDGHSFVTALYEHEGDRILTVTTHALFSGLDQVGLPLCRILRDAARDREILVDFYVWRDRPLEGGDETEATVRALINRMELPGSVRRIVVAVSGPDSGPGMAGLQHFTYRPGGEGFVEERFYRNLHPMMGKRLHQDRLSNFDIERLDSAEDVYLFHGVAHANPRDERLFGIAEVRDMTTVKDESGRVVGLPHFERMLMEVLAGIRHFQAQQPAGKRLHWNRVLLYVWPPFLLRSDELHDLMRKMSPATEGLGLETILLHVRTPQADGALKETIIYLSNLTNGNLVARFDEPTKEPIAPLTDYEQKVVRLRQRGLLHPWELIKRLTPVDDGAPSDFPPGEFIEHDLDENNQLVPVHRGPGLNKTNIIVGLLRSFTEKHPEGMTRVALFGDPTVGMGNLAEGECRRIMEGLAMASRMKVPLEWFAISAGAKISMESGTENMDWIGAVLRELIHFTQAGGEVNIVVCGINVGAQPYWNAEATMLMHTRGILIMTPEGAMVLTGKQALDYSGGVSAEDNLGIGGYERIMGRNGQAQYFARDINDACRILLRHYEHSYVAPGERFPRRAATSDPSDRDVRVFPHGRVDGIHFETVGDVFSEEKNAGRKKPFDIRRVMAATIDQDHKRLERWYRMEDAEIAVVWDAHLGGFPVCMIGLESRPIKRLGFVPAYGPDQWTGGTLFPQSSKKVARALNAASGNRPVVVLANLSGFDGSPESMYRLQLEYGAEIGRAVVNFVGPIVFCVISRYHGGAFVVFSKTLNENLEIIALEGTYASVIGGAPAAAVVFAREVEKRTERDSRIVRLDEEIANAQGAEKVRLRSRRAEMFQAVHSEKLGQVAEEFDSIHSVHRAKDVGSINAIIPPERLRPYLIDAVSRGVRREMERLSGTVDEPPGSSIGQV